MQDCDGGENGRVEGWMHAVVGKGARFEERLSPLIVPTETGPGATFETRMEV